MLEVEVQAYQGELGRLEGGGGERPPSVFVISFSLMNFSSLSQNNACSSHDKIHQSPHLKTNIISQKDIVCPEAVKIDDLDPAAVSANYDAAKSKASSAEAGSPEAAEAMIEVEVNRAMGSALGLSLA